MSKSKSDSTSSDSDDSEDRVKTPTHTDSRIKTLFAIPFKSTLEDKERHKRRVSRNSRDKKAMKWLQETILADELPVETVDDDGNTALQVAVTELKSNSKSFRMVDYLLRRADTSKNPANEFNLSHLHVACMRGLVDIVKEFLNHEVDVNLRIDDQSPLWPGDTPLHLAIRYEHVDVVKVLLNKDINLYVVNALESTPCHLAYEVGNDEILNCVLQKLMKGEIKADPKNREGLTHCYLVSLLDDLELLKRFSDIEVDTSSFITKLIKQDKMRVVSYLINRNHDNEAWSSDVLLKLIAIHDRNWIRNEKLYSRFLDFIKILLPSAEANAKIQLLRQFLCIRMGANMRTRRRAVIQLLIKFHVSTTKALLEPVDLDMAEMLLKEFGADVNARGGKKETPLHGTAARGRLDLVKLFVDEGADEKAKDTDGRTALHMAAERGRSKVTLFLVRNRHVEVNCRDKQMRTPLHRAAEQLRPNVAKILLNYGANVHARDGRGRTPLHWVAQKPSKDMMQDKKRHQPVEDSRTELRNLLIDYDSNINARDREGKTPLHICNEGLIEASDVRFTKFLIENGADIFTKDNANQFIERNCQCKVRHQPCRYKSLESHVNVLKKVGLPIIEEFLIDVFDGADYHKHDNYLFNEVEEKMLIDSRLEIQIEVMRNENLIKNLNFVDLLFKSSREMSLIVKNAHAVNVFESIDFKTLLPHYGYLINLQYKRGRDRDFLERKVTHYFKNLFPALPQLCVAKVLSYFSNDDLRDSVELLKNVTKGSNVYN